MRHAVFHLLIALVLLWSLAPSFALGADSASPSLSGSLRAAGQAQTDGENAESARTDAATPETPPEPKGAFARYGRYLDGRLGQIRDREDQFWGHTTVLLPEGALGLGFVANYKRADTRYRDDGKTGPVTGPISLDDPTGGAGEFLSVDIDAKGHLIQYELTLAYGITDPVDIYAAFPFQTEEVWLNVEVDPGTSAAFGVRSKEEFFRLIESLGRPRPTSHYKSKAWETGDFHAGVSWNYFRNDFFSGGARARVLFPTGRMADPNHALRFGLGPEIDAGMGSFAPGISHSTDLRPPSPVQWLLFSTRVDYLYYIEGKRRAPRFLSPDPEMKESLDALGLDTSLFPDLSGLDSYFFVTPKDHVDGSAILSFVFPYVSLGAAYHFSWQARPDVDAGSAAFEDLLDRFDCYEESHLHSMGGLLSVNLIRLKAPVGLDLEARFPLAGKNRMRFMDDYKGEIKLFWPF